MIGEAALMELRQITDVRLDEPLSRHTTFGVGGPADGYAVARSADELAALVRVARRHGLPCFVFGAGSNVIVGDGGVSGLTIQNDAGAVRGPDPVDAGPLHRVRAESGTSFAGIARRLSLGGWSGVEWAVGIPGSLGGAVVTNAGAYDRSLRDVLHSVVILDAAGDERSVGVDELDLRYRSSALLGGALAGAVVLSVEFDVRPGDPAELAARVAEYDEHRLSAQPRGRNSGSMFRNPPEHPAWWLIDSVGLRGHRIGNVQISEKHTNFFLNLGDARAADVRALLAVATQRVRDRFGIELEPEVALVGEWGEA